MKDTKVTCHCDEKITLGENLIYCSTLQMAWNELCDFMGGPILLKGDSSTEAAVTELNRRTTSKEDLDPKSYLALAGTVDKDIIGQIAKGLREKFDETSKVDFSGLDSDSIVAYAFLLKVLEFPYKFEEIENASFMCRAVKAFGINKVKNISPQSEQVKVLYYNSPSEFTLSLTTKSGDIITMARLLPGATLRETIGLVKMCMYDTLHENESLKIPKISFDLEQHFSELTGKNITLLSRDNIATSTDYFIADAVQFIKFDLNEEGAKLRSEAAFLAKRCMSRLPEKGREFIFDGPFLILLQQTRYNNPYFAAWIGNDEILAK